jgi:integrase
VFLPALGGYRLSDLRRVDVQDFADGLVAEGLSPSSIRNTLLPLRAIYRRALARGEVGVNPTAGLELPAVRGKRERIADAEEAAALLAALPDGERALWATAIYGGLRQGELLGLTWADVNLADGTIGIERAWDLKAGEVEPKSAAGRRTVPMAAVLRDHLLKPRMGQTHTDGLVFGRSPERPFNPSAVRARAARAWEKARLNQSDSMRSDSLSYMD